MWVSREDNTPAAHGDRREDDGRTRLVSVGERASRQVRYSAAQIAEFARLTGDSNQLHVCDEAARRAGFGGVIASGQQTTAMMMGLLASHFSRNDDGVEREMLCLNVNFAFKQPVLAEQDVLLQWTVASAEWHNKLQGMLTQLDGTAIVEGHKPSVIGRATILVKFAPWAT
jgi:acyl dehydratase